MNERELGKALLRGEEPTDIQAMTERVLRRDRRRIWFLGITCVIAWVLVVMVPWATILPAMAKVGRYAAAMNDATTPAQRQDLAVQAAEAARVGTIATFIDSIAAMFVAALLTVLLIVLSRRSTLRQVNARLREISLQIKAIAERPQ
jgi:hypothetical protein